MKLKIAFAAQKEITKVSLSRGIPITASSIKEISLGETNANLPDLKPSPLTTYKLILNGLENCNSDIVFLCANNVLYHPSHFDFYPIDRNTIYFNQNIWFLRTTDGHALHYETDQLSGLCAYKEVLINYFKRIVQNENLKLRSEFQKSRWVSEYPNIDIRYEANLNGIRWRKEQFRNQKYTSGWVESDEEIPGWGKTANLVLQF